MLRLLTLFFLFIVSTATFGQGSIAGAIKDGKTNEAVIGANVIVVGTSIGAATDIDGKFVIANVPAGTYTLQISYLAYKTHIVSDLIVENAKRVTVDVSLQEEASELQEVVVTGGRSYDTDFELLRSIKEARVVMVGITSEQIAKSLDRDASQVLRRVPGITIKDNQFVQIRGLSERYNPVMLNGIYAPSLETDVRSFSFATIPTSQIDRMLVYKSPSADVPGDFAGGVVKVYTKSIPEDNSVVLDYSMQVRAGTTFQNFYHQPRGSNYLTSFDDKSYELPSSFPANLSSVQNDAQINAGKSLKNNWAPQKGTAIPDQRFTATFNHKFHVGKVEIGNITSLSYSNAFSTYKIQRGDYTESGGNTVDQNYGFSDVQYNQQIRTGALFNWAVKFNPNNIIEFKNLYNHSSADQFVDRMGTGVSEGQKNAASSKIFNGLYSGQLMGTHELFNKLTTVEWVAGYNNSLRDQPDYKRYLSNLDGPGGQAQISIPNTVTPNQLGRFYSKLNEHALTGGASIKQRFNFTADPLRSPELKAGVFFENKSRSFRARNIGYTTASATLDPNLKYATIEQLFQPQNINNTTGLQVGEITYRKDSYTATNNLVAFYLMASVPLGSKIKLDAGVRQENNLQQLHSFDDFAGQAVDVHNQVNRLLPSANVSYNFTEKMLIRAAYGVTLNRPEFRELAPFSFYDFNFNFLYFGQPSLKTARVQNLDLRWEFYPSKTEMVTFGAFYKNFENPIEALVDINSPGGGLKNVTFANAKGAKAFGVEVEIKKSLSGLTGSRFLNNLNVLFNATVINSKITLQQANTTGREASRPMQGQAPYVINSGFFYTAEASGWQVNLLYNVVGKNIFLVGTDTYHDVYLMPRNVVDLTFTKRLGERFQLKGGIVDILNQPMNLLQDVNGDKKLDSKSDQPIQKFRPGQVFSLGFSVRL